MKFYLSWNSRSVCYCWDMCWSGLLSEDLYWVIDPILGLIWQTNRELSPGDCINSSPYILTICHANTWSKTLIQQALFIVILWFAPASRCDNFSYADWQPICFFGFHVDENYVRNTLYMLYSDTCHTFCCWNTVTVVFFFVLILLWLSGDGVFGGSCSKNEECPICGPGHRFSASV